eukprot:gnl/MRDRNA2_/MRDRNA2_17883_c0_seq2.p1 gnl/MRDRNA2_/MRDRNA2_17883_c0~~gnl/MRDRNA2_/MRDRNA2_17883_c0_seq2.p1  ORF type:complete len:138 (+),score=14.04 gnl/MRDRNA2_/MRDRNA2_17883_c0_seq2:103-516(+)
MIWSRVFQRVSTMLMMAVVIYLSRPVSASRFNGSRARRKNSTKALHEHNHPRDGIKSAGQHYMDARVHHSLARQAPSPISRKGPSMERIAPEREQLSFPQSFSTVANVLKSASNSIWRSDSPDQILSIVLMVRSNNT